MRHVKGFLESLKARNLSENTLRAYREDLREFVAFLGSGRECKRQDARRYLADLLLKPELKRKTVARKIAVLRSFFSWSAAEDYEPDEAAVITSCLHVPRVPYEIPRWPSEEQTEEVLAGPFAGGFPERDGLILQLLYGTGIRVAELVGINLEDFRDSGTVLVRGKGNKERLVIFGEPAQDALQNYLPAREELLRKWEAGTNALFFGLHGPQAGRLTTRSVLRIVKMAAKSKALPQWGPHAFRHACASHLLENGASIAAVSQLLGHANLSTTERYTHISAKCILRAYNAAHPHARGALMMPAALPQEAIATLKPGVISCAHCENPVSGNSKSLCEVHLRLNREGSKRCLEKKRASNICLRCDRRANPGSVVCAEHRKKQNDAMRHYRKRLLAEEPPARTSTAA